MPGHASWQGRPGRAGLVGMSLGGLTTIRLAAELPGLEVRSVITDVTPSSLSVHDTLTDSERGSVTLIDVRGPETFDSLYDMVPRAKAAPPGRPSPLSGVGSSTMPESCRAADERGYDRLT